MTNLIRGTFAGLGLLLVVCAILSRSAKVGSYEPVAAQVTSAEYVSRTKLRPGERAGRRGESSSYRNRRYGRRVVSQNELDHRHWIKTYAYTCRYEVDDKVYEFKGRARGVASLQSYVRLYYDSSSPARASFGKKIQLSTPLTLVCSIFLAIACFGMLPLAGKISAASEQLRTRSSGGLNNGLPEAVLAFGPGLLAIVAGLFLAIVAVSSLVRRNSGNHHLYDIEHIHPQQNQRASDSAGFSTWTTVKKFQAEFERQKKQDQFPRKIEGRNFDGQTQYRAHYVPHKRPWAAHFGQDDAGFKENDAKYRAMGYEPTGQNQFVDSKGIRRHQTTWTKTENGQRIMVLATMEATAKSLNLPLESTNTVGIKLRLIPAGEFIMGSTAAEARRWSESIPANWEEERRQQVMRSFQSEVPQRSVSVTSPFYMATTETTVAQFRQFVEATGYKTDAEADGANDGNEDANSNWTNPGFAISDEHPASMLTVDDAMAFCAWLSQEENTTYRLPSEEEWEYACRATTQTTWSSGNDLSNLNRVTWYARNSSHRLHPVAKKVGNFFGLHDMHGNATEWCRASDEDQHAVARGGGAYAAWFFTRASSIKRTGRRDYRRSDSGFRVIREISRDAP